MEDDCYLDIVRYWNFDWKSVVAKFPYDWDVVQLAIICTGDIHINLHRRFVNDFSTACYVISRHHAAKILKHHVKGKDKYRLDNGVKPRPVADDLIYNSGVTYAIPLLLYKTELGLLFIRSMLISFIKEVILQSIIIGIKMVPILT